MVKKILVSNDEKSKYKNKIFNVNNKINYLRKLRCWI
jgi:hypothetical protein